MTPVPDDRLRVCVYHPSMGRVIAERLALAHPALDVELVADVGRDPPGLEHIEVLIANTFPPGLLGRARRLRWLHLTGSGTEHVAAGEPHPALLLSTSARVPAVAVAEFAWMGLLAMAKDAVRLVDQQRGHRWRLPDARLVAGSRLVLVGLGRIGSEIARRAAAFDVTVTAVTRSGRASPLAARTLPSAGLAEAAGAADHLVLAVPDTAGTRGLVDAGVLDRLPPHACLVNVGRPGVLDTAARVRRLRTGALRAAMLDVHDLEPLPGDDERWTVPNLWVTPHGAYRFHEEEQRVAEVFAGNLEDFRAGRPLRDGTATGAGAGPR